MTIKLSQATVDHFARGRLWRVLADELPRRETRLAHLPPARLELVARHCAREAIAHGFEEPNAALYFALATIRLHPLFFAEPEIAAALARLAAQAVPSAARPTRLDEAVAPAAWTRAIDDQPVTGAAWWQHFFRQADEHGRR